MVFAASMLGALPESDSVEKNSAPSLDMPLEKAFDWIPLIFMWQTRDGAKRWLSLPKDMETRA